MPTYRVVMRREVVRHAVTTIEADSADDARAKAERLGAWDQVEVRHRIDVEPAGLEQ